MLSTLRYIQFLHLDRTGCLCDIYAVLVLLQYTALPEESVWPSPGKEPHQNVNGTVVVAIHDESTFCATVGPFPQRHGLHLTTSTTHLGRIAFI
jgi:hypothetical protein